MEVAIGIDTHKASLAAAAVDSLGRVLGVREFTNDPGGHRLLVRWVGEQARPRTIGIEGSLNYGASIARTLMDAGEDVREISPLTDPPGTAPTCTGQVRPHRRGGDRPGGGGR